MMASLKSQIKALSELLWAMHLGLGHEFGPEQQAFELKEAV
jgi:hypothetical protein